MHFNFCDLLCSRSHLLKLEPQVYLMFFGIIKCSSRPENAQPTLHHWQGPPLRSLGWAQAQAPKTAFGFTHSCTKCPTARVMELLGGGGTRSLSTTKAADKAPL